MKHLTRSGIVSIIGVVVAVSILSTLITAIKRNQELQLQIASLSTQISQLETNRAELAYKVQYYKTEAFQDKEARAKLGLQLPDEQVLILPRKSTSDLATSDITPSQPAAPKRSNFSAWMDFLFGGKG